MPVKSRENPSFRGDDFLGCWEARGSLFASVRLNARRDPGEVRETREFQDPRAVGGKGAKEVGGRND